jgi:spoIIIJ-associated protein
MDYEFEGKTQEEAIENAVKVLGLSKDDIEIEVIESKKKSFLFGTGKVRIRVVTDNDKNYLNDSEITELEKKLKDFLESIIQKMGINCKIDIFKEEDNKFILNIESGESGILIGRKGKTLDALQLLCNVYAGKMEENRNKIIVDTEDYRSRRERNIAMLARRTADHVRRSRRSVLLEAMNPFERRIVHTTLNNLKNIETVSEGEGLYKKVRVFYKESH